MSGFYVVGGVVAGNGNASMAMPQLEPEQDLRLGWEA